MEINNNDDEGDNINRNLLVNNNNNNNENNQQININRIRNNNINNNNNDEEPENIFISKYSKFTISFLFIILIKFIFLIYFYYKDLEEYKYIFEVYSIITHNQYYRCLTRYLIHFGIGHLFFELIISFYLLYLFENIFGTILALFFIIVSSIINSIIQIILSLIIFNIFYYFNVFDIVSLHYEGGFAPILFALNTFLSSYDLDYLNENNFPIYMYVKAHFSSFYALVFLAFLTPNESFMGNVSGILTGYLFKLLRNVCLPNLLFIIEIEKFLGLNKEGFFYRYITNENIFMKKLISYEQIDIDSGKEKGKEKEKKDGDENGNNEVNNNGNDNNINREAPQEEIEMSFLQNSENNNSNRNN